jgi:hypothetical protein
MKVWTGTAWLDAYASLSGALIATNNLADLTNTTTARSNLGVAIGTNVQAWDADLDTWATKTAPSGTVVGTSDTQTLTNKTLTNPTINGFTGDTSVVNIGSGQVYKDASGNVGIGTSSPSFRLDVRATSSPISAQNTNATSTTPFANNILRVASNGSNADATINFTDAVSSNGYIGMGGGNLYFAPNSGTEAMRINTSGNVLI